jgi:hypothetical protein
MEQRFRHPVDEGVTCDEIQQQVASPVPAEDCKVKPEDNGRVVRIHSLLQREQPYGFGFPHFADTHYR